MLLPLKLKGHLFICLFIYSYRRFFALHFIFAFETVALVTTFAFARIRTNCVDAMSMLTALMFPRSALVEILALLKASMETMFAYALIFSWNILANRILVFFAMVLLTLNETQNISQITVRKTN